MRRAPGVLAAGLAVAGLLSTRSGRALELVGPASGPKAEVLRRVAAAARCVLRQPAFRAAVTARRGFAETNDDGPTVLAAFDAPRSCRLGTYRRGGAFGYLMYWDRVDARHRRGSEVVEFNLNTFREDDLPFLVGTAIHECAHLLGYTHRHNDRFRHPEIEATVPYQLGFLARAHAPDCLDAPPRLRASEDSAHPSR